MNDRTASLLTSVVFAVLTTVCAIEEQTLLAFIFGYVALIILAEQT